ncbi:MAG: acyltransferase [Chitinophagaceae bacterium]
MNKIYRLIRYDWPLHFILFFTNWFPDNVALMRVRGFLIRPFFKQCGKDLRIGRNCVFGKSYNITIGNHVYIAYGNWIQGSTDIIIQDEVMFGPKSNIISGNHTRKDGSFRYGGNKYAPIIIESGAWVAGSCAVLAGAKLGKGSVLGANSVLNKEVPPNCLYAGNPAKFIKEIHD